MKDALARAFKSPAVRKAFLALVLALLAAFGVSLEAGCGSAQLPPEVAKVQSVLECQLAAFERVVPRDVALDMAKAVRDGDGKRVVEQLLGLGLTLDDVRSVAAAFNACASPPEADAGAPTPERG